MSALLASFFEVSVLFSFLPEINGTPCLWMGPEEQENPPQWPSRTSAVITLLVSRTGTFIFLKKGQTSASRSVERGELCLCLMSMHLWQEEAHHTDFFLASRVSRSPLSLLFYFPECKDLQPSRVQRPLVAAPDSVKEWGRFLDRFWRDDIFLMISYSCVPCGI